MFRIRFHWSHEHIHLEAIVLETNNVRGADRRKCAKEETPEHRGLGGTILYQWVYYYQCGNGLRELKDRV